MGLNEQYDEMYHRRNAVIAADRPPWEPETAAADKPPWESEASEFRVIVKDSHTTVDCGSGLYDFGSLNEAWRWVLGVQMSTKNYHQERKRYGRLK
ncbi:MAG: hypothetical protein LBH28_08450 [Oscillospiraceae bacterium]|jgi:hypothetical protein|nr:hypothetical protein [Oscillospiraceae bacterium]